MHRSSPASSSGRAPASHPHASSSSGYQRPARLLRCSAPTSSKRSRRSRRRSCLSRISTTTRTRTVRTRSRGSRGPRGADGGRPQQARTNDADCAPDSLSYPDLPASASLEELGAYVGNLPTSNERREPRLSRRLHLRGCQSAFAEAGPQEEAPARPPNQWRTTRAPRSGS